MLIDGVNYVREDSVQHDEVTFTGEESVASRMIGKFVIVRSRNEGINAGTVVMADSSGVELRNARRLWFHRPNDKSLSWYEGVAISGLSQESKVSGTVLSKVIIEDYSMTLCDGDVATSIMEAQPHAQSDRD